MFIMQVTCVMLSYSLPLSNIHLSHPKSVDRRHTRIAKISALKYDSLGKGVDSPREKILHRTLNLFLFILRGYKMVAKRFSSVDRQKNNIKKKERGRDERRRKLGRGAG